MESLTWPLQTSPSVAHPCGHPPSPLLTSPTLLTPRSFHSHTPRSTVQRSVCTSRVKQPQSRKGRGGAERGLVGPSGHTGEASRGPALMPAACPVAHCTSWACPRPSSPLSQPRPGNLGPQDEGGDSSYSALDPMVPAGLARLGPFPRGPGGLCLLGAGPQPARLPVWLTEEV